MTAEAVKQRFFDGFPVLKDKPVLRIPARDWVWPILFMLGLSLTGLRFPLGWILLFVCLVDRLMHDRYDFLIMLTIMFGGYNTVNSDDIYFTHQRFIVFGCILLMMFLRKYPLIKKLMLGWVAYFAVLLAMAMCSEESMSVQIMSMCNYLTVCWFVVPLAVFANRDFDMDTLIRRLFPYAMIFCLYYFLDSCIMCADFFMPRDLARTNQIKPTFNTIHIYPFRFWWLRLWPPGLYWLMLLVVPVIYKYRLPKWMWVAVILALAVSRTFNMYLTLLFLFLLFLPKKTQIVRLCSIGFVLFACLYLVDASMGTSEDGVTKLRIKSHIDQLFIMQNAQDEEDMAKAGTGRAARIIPKMIHLYEENREWTGWGFLSWNSTNPKFYIHNELMLDPDYQDDLITGVECAPLELLLNAGYIGLAAGIVFYIFLWFCVRGLKYSAFFKAPLIAFTILGLTGLSGLIFPAGNLIVGLALGCVVLANRDHLPGYLSGRRRIIQNGSEPAVPAAASPHTDVRP